MELTKEDFNAKALEIQSEITQQLTQICVEKGTKHLPVKVVNGVFHAAIAYYLEWAYFEGVKVHTPKIMIGSEDKKG